jgi:hypothetical protein
VNADRALRLIFQMVGFTYGKRVKRGMADRALRLIVLNGSGFYLWQKS